MRRAKRLVSSSETEVVTEEHDHQTCVYALPRPDVWGQPYDFAAAFSVNEDSGFINGTNGINVNEDSLEPPLKMLKVTEKESLPPPSTLPYSGDPPSPERLESTFGAMSTGERCDNTVVMHKEVTASLCSGALDNRQKPLVSTRRLPRYQVEPSRKVPPVREWDASNELSESFVKGSSVILFSSEDGSSDSTWCSTTDSGEDNELSSTVVRRKRRGSTTKYKERELDRHFAGYESGELVSVAGSSCEEGEEVEVEEAEEEEEEEEDVEEREGMVDAGEDMGALKLGGFGLFGRQCLHRRRQQQRDGSQNAFPDCPMNERKTDNTAGKKLIAGGIPQRIAGILFEMHVGHRSPVPCHHTLLHVQHPTTVQGPCGIIGFGIGEVTISGFFLGRKQLVLLSESQRVVLIPVDQLKCKNAQLDTVPTPRQPKEETEHWGGRVTLIPEKCSATRMVTGGNASEKAVHEDSKLNNDDLLYDDDVEMFGAIDWDWVETVVASWRGRFLSSSFNIILVVQPCYNNGALPTRRFYIKPRGLSGEMEPVAKSCSTSKLPAGDFIDVPIFVARRAEISVDAVLLPDVIPAIVKQGTGSVFVIGSQGVGKSTLVRFLANAFFSLYGISYWLELDLGQPEFGPPGTFALYRVRRPLFRPRDTAAVELVKGFYIGGSRPQCPISTAIALESICAYVERLQKHFPVVVNTHGWVLSTGRRLTVEALRRLLPTHMIHLVREGEEQWVRAGKVILSPVNGLNASVLHKRFLVHKRTASAGWCTTEEVIRQLPLPYRSSANSNSGLPKWDGKVHTVQIQRDKVSPQPVVKPKASVRQAAWHQVLAPILNYYELVLNNNAKEALSLPTRQESTGSDNRLEATTLLTSLLDQYDAIVFTDVADSSLLTNEFVYAALEHSVVALSINRVPLSTSGSTEKGKRVLGGDCCANYRCLADLPAGFCFSCFGVVESSEVEMQKTGEIRVRLPFRREVLHTMLCDYGADERMGISLACTLNDRADTSLLESYLENDKAETECWRRR